MVKTRTRDRDENNHLTNMYLIIEISFPLYWA
jgi:hypothetical protein